MQIKMCGFPIADKQIGVKHHDLLFQYAEAIPVNSKHQMVF